MPKMVRAHNPPRQEIALRDYEVGPDMLALTDRQRAFVFHLVDQGGMDHHRAASKAGYKGDTETLRVTGWRLAHDERIGLAMIEEAERQGRLKPGDTIKKTQSAIVLEKMISQFMFSKASESTDAAKK